MTFDVVTITYNGLKKVSSCLSTVRETNFRKVVLFKPVRGQLFVFGIMSYLN